MRAARRSLKSAFGDGDVLLATLAGFMLGWQALIYAVMIAVFAGGLGAFIYLGGRLLVRGRYEWFTALPYGQYIVFGTLLMLLWRAEVLALFGVRL
jgi:prepilin signal peptidase PulO-like enzyme (type II secretory pathway)